MTALREPTLPPPTFLRDVHRLGVLRGRTWVRSGASEFVLDPVGIPDRDPVRRLAEGAVYVADESAAETIYFRAVARPLGTFANGGRLPTVAKAPRKSRPPRRIDALGSVPLFAGREERWTELPLRGEDRAQPLDELTAAHLADMPVRLVRRLVEPRPAITGHHPARPAARGKPAIRARLARIGIEVRDLPDGRLDVLTPGGARLDAAGRAALDAALPVLAAESCALCTAEPWTICVGGLVVCERHATEDVAPPTLRERVGRALRG